MKGPIPIRRGLPGPPIDPVTRDKLLTEEMVSILRNLLWSWRKKKATPVEVSP